MYFLIPIQAHLRQDLIKNIFFRKRKCHRIGFGEEIEKKILKSDKMGQVKRKGAFEHVQNVQIQIHPAYAQSHPGICSPLILSIFLNDSVCLFVLRFYGPVNPMGHVEHGQFT